MAQTLGPAQYQLDRRRSRARQDGDKGGMGAEEKTQGSEGGDMKKLLLLTTLLIACSARSLDEPLREHLVSVRNVVLGGDAYYGQAQLYKIQDGVVICYILKGSEWLKVSPLGLSCVVTEGRK